MRFITSTICGLALLLVSNAVPAYSCRCAVETRREDFKKASAVFVGKVLEIKKNENYDPQKDALALYEIRLKVVKRWKGAREPEIKILSNNGPQGACAGFTFEKDEQYLIYAHGKNKVAHTFCSNSGPVDDKSAQEAIRELNSSRIHFKTGSIWPF